ncbi:MAG: hypothetical protein HRU12_03485 [Phaeodactylibacter sp.]|nr:hypothetical protein [Phaeodactylibacter sp.]
MATKEKTITKTLTIEKPRFNTLAIEIEGTAPYLQCRFSAKAMQAMMAKMEAGSTSRSKKTKEARDFDEDFLQAQHVADEGWNGIPASAFRSACIDACRMAGFKMTHAKMSIFIEADGFDQVDGVPLVQIQGNPPERTEMAVRIQQTTDIRIRPMWRKWGAILRVRYDEGQFTDEDVVNLLLRAGQQVGIGEGRPFSKSSNGMGYGLFIIKNVSNV